MTSNPYDDLVGKPREGPAPTPTTDVPPQTSGNPYDVLVGQRPSPPVAPAAVGPQVGVGEDIARTAPSALARGVSGLVGLPGTMQDLVRSGIDKILPPSQKQLEARQQAPNLLPSAQALQSGVERVTGPLYEPKTTPGKYFGAAVEAAPSMTLGGPGIGWGARALSAVGGGLGGEAGGQAFAGGPVEPYARLAGGLVGGVVAPKTVTPFTNVNTPARQAQVNRLQDEGIPLRAGQRLGSPTLQSIENSAATSTGGIGAGQRINERQAAAFERAVSDRAYPRTGPGAVTGNAPDPDVLTAGRKSLSDEYNRLTNAHSIHWDQQLGKGLDDAVDKAKGALTSTTKADVTKLSALRDDISNSLLAGQGTQSGKWYQQARSDLGDIARDNKLNNTNLSNAAKSMQRTLDSAMERSLPSQAAIDEWRLNNKRWSTMRTLERASGYTSGGSRITPQNMVQAQKVGRASEAARQTQDLDRLAVAARDVMTPLPKAERGAGATAMRMLRLAAPGGGAGYLAGPAVGAAAAVTSPALSRAALSDVGQRYLGNQVSPIAARDALTRALIEQELSQSR